VTSLFDVTRDVIKLEKAERELMGLWESTWKLKASMTSLKRPHAVDYFRTACSLPGFSGLMFTGNAGL
jgi:hypothetical protein